MLISFIVNSTVTRQFELVSVLGSIHAKEMLRNRELLGVKRQKSRDRSPTRWDLMATVADQETPITVSRQGEDFKVSFNSSTEKYRRMASVIACGTSCGLGGASVHDHERKSFSSTSFAKRGPRFSFRLDFVR